MRASVADYALRATARCGAGTNKKGSPGGFPIAQRPIGAGNETRTRDLNLGKVALYQLSYSRI